MTARRWKLAALLLAPAAVAFAAGIAIPLAAQEGPRKAPPPDPVLGYIGLVGNKASTQAFLRTLGGVKEDDRGAGQGRLSLFLPDFEQVYLFGNKEGVVAFARGLPEGSTVRVLVQDAERLRNFGDRASTLALLEALAARHCMLDLWITDLPGLAKNGQNAAVLRFVECLPRGSSVQIFATAKEIYLHGDTAGLLGFLSALKVRVEVRVDDPLLDVYLK